MSTKSQARIRLLLSIAVTAGILVAGAHALAGLRLAEVGADLRRVDAWPLVIAALGPCLVQLCRAVLWRLALRHHAPIPVSRLFRYTLLGTASSVLLPARAGEAVRVWVLSELEGVAPADSIGAALAERALDLVSMVVVLAPLPLLLPEVPRWIARAELGLVAAAIAIVISIAVLARRGEHGAGLVARLGRALSPLSSWPRLLGALSVMGVGWLIDVSMLLLVARALDLTLPPAAPLLVLLSVNLAIAVPAAPAQLGTHEAGTLVALGLLGVDRAEAVAFALLYHATHVIPLLAAAAIDAPLLARVLRRHRADATDAERAA